MIVILPDGFCVWSSEHGEAIKFDNTDMKFCDLAVKIPCYQTVTQKLESSKTPSFLAG